MVNILELAEGDYVKVLNTGIDLDLYPEVEDMLTEDRLKVREPVQDYKFPKGEEYIAVWDNYESDFQYFSADELELVETVKAESDRLLDERMERRDDNRGISKGSTAKEQKKIAANKASREANGEVVDGIARDSSNGGAQPKPVPEPEESNIVADIMEDFENGNLKEYTQEEIDEHINPTLPVGVEAFTVRIIPNEAPMGLEDLDKDEWETRTRIEAFDIFDAVQKLADAYGYNYDEAVEDIESSSVAYYTVETNEGECFFELERT